MREDIYISDPGMHYGTCMTHVPWRMSGSLTCDSGENILAIHGACANRNLGIWAESHKAIYIWVEIDEYKIKRFHVNSLPDYGSRLLKRWGHSMADRISLLTVPQGLCSLSGKTSYCKISWSLEAARFGFSLYQSLLNLTGTSAALLPKCLSNCRVIRPL